MMTSEYLEHCQRVPEWMKEREMAAVLQRNDILELRFGSLGKLMEVEPRTHLEESLETLGEEALIMLRFDLLQVPSIAEHVPPEFLKVLSQKRPFSYMAPLEQAAVVILENDRKELSLEFDWLNPEITTDFLQLKWQALAMLLKEAQDAK